MGCLHSVEEEIRPIPSAVSLKYGGIAKRGPGSGHHGEEVENSEEHNDSIATVGRTRSNRVKEVSFSGSNTSSRSRLRQQLTTQNVLHHSSVKKMLQSIPPQTWERQVFDDVLSRCTREDEFLDLLRDAQKLPGLAEFFLPMEDAPKALRDRAALVSIFRRVLEAQYVHPEANGETTLKTASFSIVSSPSMKKSGVYACDGPLSDSTATSSSNNNTTNNNIPPASPAGDNDSSATGSRLTIPHSSCLEFNSQSSGASRTILGMPMTHSPSHASQVATLAISRKCQMVPSPHGSPLGSTHYYGEDGKSLPSGDFFMEVHPHVVPSTEES